MDYVSVAEAAELTGRSKSWIYSKLKAGDIASIEDVFPDSTPCGKTVTQKMIPRPEIERIAEAFPKEDSSRNAVVKRDWKGSGNGRGNIDPEFLNEFITRILDDYTQKNRVFIDRIEHLESEIEQLRADLLAAKHENEQLREKFAQRRARDRSQFEELQEQFEDLQAELEWASAPWYRRIF